MAHTAGGVRHHPLVCEVSVSARHARHPGVFPTGERGVGLAGRGACSMSPAATSAHPLSCRSHGKDRKEGLEMGTTTLTQLSNRDRAVLRAIADGRCVVSG